MLMRISVLIKLGGPVGHHYSLWSDVNQNFKWPFRVDHKFLFRSFFLKKNKNRVICFNDVIGIIIDGYNCLTKKKLYLLSEWPEVPLEEMVIQ